MSIVEARQVRVEMVNSGVDIVTDVSFDINAGEVMGVVGESGSGKTTVGVALLGYARKGGRIARGTVSVDGTQVLELSEGELTAARGSLVSYIPQDPTAALNPALRIGRQLLEQIEIHEPAVSRADATQRVRKILREVNLPDNDEFMRRFPHQLSGGQAQRVCIAMAFVLRPKLVVLDEPTTGLDVTTQSHVLATVRDVCAHSGAAILYVSHDLAVVSNVADRVLVMYAGQVVEQGPTETIFGAPKHPYTIGLIAANPKIDSDGQLQFIPGSVPELGKRPFGCSFHPRCSWGETACTQKEIELTAIDAGHVVRCRRADEVKASRPAATSARAPSPRVSEDTILAVGGVSVSHGKLRVLHDVSLNIGTGECVALVGESGSGKTTLARTIAGLHTADSGDIRLRGAPLPPQVRSRSKEERRAIQYIFQSPFNSLNPRRTIGETLSMPIRQFFDVSSRELGIRIADALDQVSLPRAAAMKHPSDLSGGERQRVAIARALVSSPDLIVCDEVTSALDVSVQAVIVNLLRELQRENNLALLFVTHNIGLLGSIADRVAVMQRGRIIEQGTVNSVMHHPQEPYTRHLIADTPAIPSRLLADTST